MIMCDNVLQDTRTHIAHLISMEVSELEWICYNGTIKWEFRSNDSVFDILLVVNIGYTGT